MVSRIQFLCLSLILVTGCLAYAEDGRVLKLKTTVATRRPKVTLISKHIQVAQSAIRLGSQDDLRLDGQISFFVKAEIPARFEHDEKIEVASADGFFHTVLSLENKGISLQDSQTKEVRCPDDPDKQCTLSGDMLYLIDSIAADADFADPVSVPSGFADSSLAVPRPNGTLLYLKLRDDPDTVNTTVLPVLPEQYSAPGT